MHNVWLAERLLPPTPGPGAHATRAPPIQIAATPPFSTPANPFAHYPEGGRRTVATRKTPKLANKNSKPPGRSTRNRGTTQYSTRKQKQMAESVRVIMRSTIRRSWIWRRTWDPFWRHYYYWNTQTGESTWNIPVVVIEIPILQNWCAVCNTWHNVGPLWYVNPMEL